MDYTNITVPTSTPEEATNPNEKEQIKPVIETQNVTVKKAGVGKKLYSVFFSASPEEVAKDLKRTVLIPAIKRGILDIITIGASMLINGKDSTSAYNWSSPYSLGGTLGTIIDYNGISTGKVVNSNAANRTSPLGVLTLDTIGFKTEADARVVLYNMNKYLEQYKVVTVSEYYEFCGYNGYDWQAKYWGWDNLSGADVVPKILPNGGRYIITLPPVRPLNKQ